MGEDGRTVTEQDSPLGARMVFRLRGCGRAVIFEAKSMTSVVVEEGRAAATTLATDNGSLLAARTAEAYKRGGRRDAVL